MEPTTTEDIGNEYADHMTPAKRLRRQPTRKERDRRNTGHTILTMVLVILGALAMGLIPLRIVWPL